MKRYLQLTTAIATKQRAREAGSAVAFALLNP
jgi:hypothetical protein